MKEITFSTFEMMLIDTTTAANRLERFVKLVDAIVAKAVSNRSGEEFDLNTRLDLHDLDNLRYVALGFEKARQHQAAYAEAMEKLAVYPAAFSAALKSLEVTSVSGIGAENVTFLKEMGIDGGTVFNA